MFKFLRLVGYLISKRKLLINAAFGVLAVVLIFLLLNVVIFSVVSYKTETFDVLTFVGKGLFHLVLASIIFVRYAYKYLINKLFSALFDENKEAVFDAVGTFMLDNKQAARLTATNEDNYLLKMNGYIATLPRFLRIVFAKGLSFVPFYEIYTESLQQDLPQEDRVAWLVEHVKAASMKRFDNYFVVIILLLIPIVNWGVMLTYLNW